MKTRRFLISLYAVLLLLAVFSPRAEALGHGSYHPPAVTIVAYGAPKDLELQVEMEYDGERFPVTLVKEDRLWESSFRLYREGSYRMKAWFGNDKDFKNAVLLCRSGGEEKRVPLRGDLFTPGGSDDKLTLSCADWTVTAGLPGWRAPLLFALRLLLILLLKAVIFFLYDYRRGSSWLRFLGVELVVLGVMNALVINWINVDMENVYPLYFLGLLAAFMVEMLVYVLLLEEQPRDRAVSFIAVSNVTGCLGQMLLLSFFPV